MMNSEEKKLIIDFYLKRINEDEFLHQFPGNPKIDKEYVLHLLEGAFRERDAIAVECSLILGYKFGFSEKCGDILCKLILEDWHNQHENIARTLQELKYPDAVDCLYQAALTSFPYLDYDDNYALGVKCVWALYAIGTDSAKEKLTLLAQGDNEIIAYNARQLLNRMNP